MIDLNNHVGTNEQVLTMFYGNIASGKSTIAKEAAKQGVVVVNNDSIVNMVHSDQYTLYKKDLKQLYRSIEECAIITALEMGLNVLVDRCCEHKSTRERFIRLARKVFGTKTCVIVTSWEDPEVHAKRRVEADDRGVSYEQWLNAATYKNDSREDIDDDEDIDIIIEV